MDFLLSLLFLNIAVILFVNKFFNKLIFNIALLLTNVVFFTSIFYWFNYSGLIQIKKFARPLILDFPYTLDVWDIVYYFVYSVHEYDSLSMLFVLLTTFITPICILAGKNLPHQKELILTILILELLLVLTFTASNLILFYICFEALLIPMFYLIIKWGSRSRKIKAAFYLFLYTALGSIFFFISFALLYAEFSYFNFNSSFLYYIKFIQFNEKIGYINFDFYRQLIIWFGFFITFAIKIPIFPFHIWLPEAHVEAPTVGSVILASLLLKVGGYGMIKFLMIFERATKYMQPFIYTLCLISILYASLSALRQLDIKKIIAYSSIAHMNFVVLAIFTLTLDGLNGAVILMLGHGIVSGALFLLIGVLYERYHSRNVLYYGGLTQVMPLTSFLFFFFSISNFSFPGTANFIGEFLILKSVLQTNTFITILLLISSICTVGYSMFLYNRIFFGNLKITASETFTDIKRFEFYYFCPLIITNLLIGLYPNIFLLPLQNTLYIFINFPII